MNNELIALGFWFLSPSVMLPGDPQVQRELQWTSGFPESRGIGALGLL